MLRSARRYTYDEGDVIVLLPGNLSPASIGLLQAKLDGLAADLNARCLEESRASLSGWPGWPPSSRAEAAQTAQRGPFSTVLRRLEDRCRRSRQPRHAPSPDPVGSGPSAGAGP